MDTFLHYLPYILGAVIAVLVLVCLSSGSSGRKHIEPWRPKERYPRRPSSPRTGSRAPARGMAGTRTPV